MRHPCLHFSSTPLLPFVLALSLPAQCFPTWQPGLGIPGVDGFVNAITTWDPDGAGPAQPLVVLGGDFQNAGEWSWQYVTGWLPQAGQFVNMSSPAGRVEALATLPTGELVAGGYFAGGVARFDGFSWTTIGAGLDAVVRALAVLPNGDLVAGGDFATNNRVARWDGTVWQPLGSGMDASVRALLVQPNGELIAGGDFDFAGGVVCTRIARWNGSIWSPLGLGMGGGPTTFTSVNTLARLGSGEVVAGGGFTTAGGNPANRLARWNGGSWSAFGSGVDGVVRGSYVTSNGDLLVVGAFTQVDGIAAPRLARWNGTTWSGVGSGGPDLAASAVTTLPSGDIYLGGQFREVAGVPARCVARWNGNSWSALGSGTDDRVGTTLTMANGDLVVGGAFRMIDGTTARRVARRVGTSWTTFGSGMTHPTSECVVYALAELPNGDLIAGGVFTQAGGVAANNIARWNGTSWAPLGAGLPIGVQALVALPNGDVLAGGGFTTASGAPADYLARWDGSAWTPVGGNFTGPWYGAVARLARLGNGDIVAGGVFTAAPGVATDNLARWDGVQWHALGQPMSPSSRVGALAVAGNGDLLVGGTWTTIGGIAANYVARWNGVSWSPVGNLQPWLSTSVACLAELPDGDVMAGGINLRSFGLSAGLVRWDGTNWLTPWSPAGWVFSLSLTAAGELAAGGLFTTQSRAAYFAVLSTACTATATPIGAGCTGSGGANTLAAVTLPWTGSTFTARATGLAPNSLAICVRGLALVNVPLAPLLPQALSGCNLLVSPDLLDLYLPLVAAPGTAELTFPIPDSSALTGAVLYQQAVPVAFAASGAIAEFSASNALTLTIGTW